MSQPYSVLNKLPPEAFLHPEKFVTEYDSWAGNEDLPEKKYQEGLKVSNESVEVGICENGTWYACGANGSYTTSYEGIGYHAGTSSLLKGLLAGKAKFVVHRWNGERGTRTCIKEGVL
jgi:hypothetical protein